jgi:predicted small secreted protein
MEVALCILAVAAQCTLLARLQVPYVESVNRVIECIQHRAHVLHVIVLHASAIHTSCNTTLVNNVSLLL